MITRISLLGTAVALVCCLWSGLSIELWFRGRHDIPSTVSVMNVGGRKPVGLGSFKVNPDSAKEFQRLPLGMSLPSAMGFVSPKKSAPLTIEEVVLRNGAGFELFRWHELPDPKQASANNLTWSLPMPTTRWLVHFKRVATGLGLATLVSAALFWTFLAADDGRLNWRGAGVAVWRELCALLMLGKRRTGGAGATASAEVQGLPSAERPTRDEL